MTAQLNCPGFSLVEADLLDEILRNQQVYSVFQPLVHLQDDAIVGYEALARGPAGELANPDQLFVNVEPEALELESLAALLQLTDSAGPGPQLVLEITERALAFHPAELMRSVEHLREAGWRIALDDVGADDLSPAFMPLLRPDVIKLDMQVVQSRPDAAIAQIMNAVNAYAERSGCLLVAEGIESPRHLAVARSLGAQVGQGWLFGRPSAITVTGNQASDPLRVPASTSALTPPSPFSCVPPTMALRESTKPLLIEVSKHLERQAAQLGSSCLLLSTFQDRHQFSRITADRHLQLATTVGFVAAVGGGMTEEPTPGVRGAHLPPGDPVVQEWDVIVLAPHFAAALLAKDLNSSTTESDRTFAFVLTYDRDIVERAARSLMSRIQRFPLPLTSRST